MDEFRKTAGNLAGKATGAIGDNADKVKSGIGKAGSFVDGRTSGKYSRQINGAQSKAAGLVDSLDKNKNDENGNRRDQDGPGTPGSTPPAG